MATKWHSGPPPSIGWWIASTAQNERVLRWWNGTSWSVSANRYSTLEQAYKSAVTESGHQDHVEWTDRPKSWPARSKT